MFRAMVQLESGLGTEGEGVEALEGSTSVEGLTQSPKQNPKVQEQADKPWQLPQAAVQRVRAVYDAWVAAYGSSGVELWVQYALFEQQHSKQGPGRVYYKAVKELADPDEFIQEYRSRVGLV